MKNKFWRLGLRAVMDKACQREIMDSVTKKAKACASALVAPLMLAAAVAVAVIAAVGVGAWNHVGFFGLDKPQVTLLRLDASERALLGSKTLWGYKSFDDALKKANAGEGPSDLFLGASDASRVAKDLKEWRSSGKQSDDARAATELLSLARSGASWEQASAKLREVTRGSTEPERWRALEEKLKAAPRFEVGVMEVFVAFWPGERGARDQAVSAEMGPFFLVEGVVLLLFAVLIILLVVSGGMLVVGKIKDFIGRHQERLESEVEAADLKRASLAAPKNQNKKAGRI